MIKALNWKINRILNMEEEMNQIEAVLFDMDGLMFDTEKLWLDGVKMTNEVYGYDVPLDLIVECMGLRMEKIDLVLKDKISPDFDTFEFRRLNRLFMNDDVARNGLKKKKGLVELLEFLKSKNVTMAVVSSSAMERLNQRFEQGNLSKDYFTYIISGDMVSEPKPSPLIYQKCCEVLGIKPENAIALEDSESGIKSAYYAGVKPILIPDIKKPSKEIEKMAYKKFTDLSEVISLFK